MSTLAADKPGQAPAPYPAAATIGWGQVLLPLGILLGLAPLLGKFLADLWTRPQYQFFPLILGGAALLIWDRNKDARELRSAVTARVLGALLLAMAFAAIVVGDLYYARWFGGVAGWLALAGVALWLGGLGLLGRVTPALVLLLVIIPPPMRLDERLALGLRTWAVAASGRLLDVFHVPNVISGTLINISGRRLGVEEACSGINSLLAVTAVTILVGFWRHRPAWRVAVLALVAILFVIWANVLRIVIGAVLIDRFHIDILSGSAHALLGLILFLLCVAMTTSFDQLLELAIGRVDRAQRVPASGPLPCPPPAGTPREGENAAGPPTTTACFPPPSAYPPGEGRGGGSDTKTTSLSLSLPIIILFLVLGIFSQLRVGRMWRASRLPDGAVFNLPQQLARWQRMEGSEQVIGRPELLGQHSMLWNFRNGPLIAVVGFDYTFPGYHDLRSCYGPSGWSTRSDQDQADAAGPYRAMQLERPPGAYAYVLFALCDEQGKWTPRPQRDPATSLVISESRRVATSSPLYQVQVLVQGYNPLDPDQQRAVQSLFLSARRALAEQLVAQVEAGK